jgi:hypothetical protein
MGAAALFALRRAGIEFRSVGDRPWQPPPLQPWEEPIENPGVPHPRHLDLRAQCREQKRINVTPRDSAALPHGTSVPAMAPGTPTGRRTPARLAAGGRLVQWSDQSESINENTRDN